MQTSKDPYYEDLFFNIDTRNKRKVRFIIFLGTLFLLLFLGVTQGRAQSWEEEKNEDNVSYEDVYNTEKFKDLDKDKDGALSPEELKAGAGWSEIFGLSSKQASVPKVERNANGNIPQKAAIHLKAWERKNRTKLKHLYRKEHLLWFKDHKWLKNHPGVLKKLVKNADYLEKHPNVAKAVYEDQKWLKKHPKVAANLYGNKKFLKKHPKLAKQAKLHHQKVKVKKAKKDLKKARRINKKRQN